MYKYSGNYFAFLFVSYCIANNIHPIMYLSKSEWKLLSFDKSRRSGKMYDAILQNKITKKIRRLPFGSVDYKNYRDITGLNLYPQLIHGDKNRRRLFRARHKGYLRDGYWSGSYFSYFFLW